MEINNKIPLIVIVGATASGKTGLSIILAKKLDGEIISADSMQIYKGMDIATAKPTVSEMSGIPHHLMNFLSPYESFSVAEYVKMTREKIQDIYNRGKLPILVGGTGLYISSILDNVQFTEGDTDYALRERLKKRLENEGAENLLNELKRFDPKTAQTLLPSNTKRIIRAFEIYETTGVTMSEQIEKSKSIPSPYKSLVIGLNYSNRQNLYNRINERVDMMLQKGLLEETKFVLSQNYCKNAMSAIGYKELVPYLKGEVTFEQAVDKLKMETRRYAKRQLTWFRKISNINWINVDEYGNYEEILKKSMDIIEENNIL